MILIEKHSYEGFSAGRHDLFRWRVCAGWLSVFGDEVRLSVVFRELRERIRTLSLELQQRKSGSSSVSKE